MPHFKTITIRAINKAGVVAERKIATQISADGIFYANVEADLLPGLPSSMVSAKGRVEGQIRVQSPTFDALEGALSKALHTIITPTITEEAVIRYNIESHVSFATDEQGVIYPNAGFPGASWGRNREMYGDHHANQPAKGGYSLCIGAKAMLKRTIQYGDKRRVEYDDYYRGGDHLGHDNPAELLNAWRSFSLPDNAREMPYSDEAALFFHRLMLSMAEISRRIQEASFDPVQLQQLIDRSGGVGLLTER